MSQLEVFYYELLTRVELNMYMKKVENVIMEKTYSYKYTPRRLECIVYMKVEHRHGICYQLTASDILLSALDIYCNFGEVAEMFLEIYQTLSEFQTYRLRMKSGSFVRSPALFRALK